MARCGSQPVPTLQPPGKPATTIIKCYRFDAACRDSAVDERLGGAIDLGNRYLHSCLDGIEPCLRLAPGIDCLRVQTYCRTIRTVQGLQKLRRCFAIVHRWSTDKTKAG